jgi:hypothetical protein
MIKQAIFVDREGFMVEFVMVRVEPKFNKVGTREDDEGNLIPEFARVEGEYIETPIRYELQNGESLIFEDINTALRMLKPRWCGEKWLETATEEEIEASRPTLPEIKPPAFLEKIAEIDDLMNTILGVTQNE